MSSIKQNLSKSRKARTSVAQHVVPQDGRWVVRGTGSKRATSIHNTQAEAIEAARQIARNQHSQVVIHIFIAGTVASDIEFLIRQPMR